MHNYFGELVLARALLQNADLLVLDESFAALNPHGKNLRATLERVKTVVVIAIHK